MKKFYFLGKNRPGVGSDLKLLGKPRDSPSVLKALPGKLDIKRHSPIILYLVLSYDVTPGSEIMLCNKIDKPKVVYRFSGNVMTSITTLRT